jgi:uncharacterized phage protein gp47/JayE
MPWPIPQPTDIADRAAAVYEIEFARIWALLNPNAPPGQVDARSPASCLAVHSRVLGMTGFDLYAMQARLAQEMMITTATPGPDGWLPKHGQTWGVPQDQPVAAAGNLVLPGGSIGTVIPGDFAFSVNGGGVYEVVNATTIEAAGTISVGVSAAVAGTAGDLAAGVTLTAVSAMGGLFSQSGTVDINGITGGQDLEATESWRARIIQRIQQRGAGGDADDFTQWTLEVLPGSMVYPFSPGVGLITVAIAMPVLNGLGQQTAWRVPTGTELSEATAYLNDAAVRKPLGAPVVDVIAATLQPVNFTLHMNPDTVAVQQGATAALQLYFVSGDITINGTLDVSRSDNAISFAAGAYNFDRSVPSGDVSPGTISSLFTFGTVTFV